MKVAFPYPDVPPLHLRGAGPARVFRFPDHGTSVTGTAAVERALSHPLGSPRLRELAAGRKNALVVVDDISRPTPVAQFISLVTRELREAGLPDESVSFIMALGTHRPMSRPEMTAKLGADTMARHRVYNHDWRDAGSLERLGRTDQGAPVWINRIVRQHDLVVGIGAIIPIDICGYTGGGKILVPGLSGAETVDQMHWTRVDLPDERILGMADNPVRASIDSLARKAGLHFIVNVILDAHGGIAYAVAGDMVAAHRAGCRLAERVYGVPVPREYDIVVADSHPYDIEFWQANKALDTAGHFVRPGGVIILVTPCTEGWSRTHAEDILRYGYRPVAEIRKLVDEGVITHKVVGVHMCQVSRAAIEKARLILVSSGIGREQAEQVGFRWSGDPQAAFEEARAIVGVKRPSVAVLEGASRMLPLKR